MHLFVKDKSFYRSFFSMMFIIAMQNLITYAVNLADNVMIGGYSQDALSGVAMVNQIQFLLQMIVGGIGNGLVVLGAQYWGKKQIEPVRRVTSIAMVLGIAQANNFKSNMTYEILLMVVLGGIGSISGSVIGSVLFVAASEWWLRGLDSGVFLGINAPGIFRNGFRLVVFSVIIMIVVLFFRKGIMGDRELPEQLGKLWKKIRSLFAKKVKTEEVADHE